MKKKSNSVKALENEIVIKRNYNAPRDLVWKAWTEPERVKQWWGPKIFTTPVVKIDLRVGGESLFCMRSPDGKDYWSVGVYKEIVPQEKIVSTDNFADEKGNIVPASYYGLTGDVPLEMLMTVTFSAAGNGTMMMLRHIGLPAGEMIEQAKEGWNESFDKLEKYLDIANRTRIIAVQGKPEIITTTIFDAPHELVFKASTDPDLVPQWWGPRGFTNKVDMMDVKPGGKWRVIQRAPDGKEYAFYGTYREIVPNHRLIYTFNFEGMPGHEALEEITFEKLDGKTKMTDKLSFKTIEERDSMFKSGMEQGAIESMDLLAELLEKLQKK